LENSLVSKTEGGYEFQRQLALHCGRMPYVSLTRLLRGTGHLYYTQVVTPRQVRTTCGSGW